MQETQNEITGREACPQCRKNGNDTKGDNLVRYSDGGAHCFACKYHEFGEGDGPQKVKLTNTVKDWKPIQGKVVGLTHRKISERIAKLFGYRVAKVKGELVEVADYRDKHGHLIGQKIRLKNKRFRTKGEMKKPPLWGQHLWRHGGRRVIVTEGEIDALSVSQLLHGKWPVVSLPAGAQSAEAVFKREAEWLNSYDEVVICFDNDEAGQEAAIEAASALRPGKAKIVQLPEKDANDMLRKNKSAALSTALWEAKTYRPDGILHVSEIDTDGDKADWIAPYPWSDMTKALMGQRSGELVMMTSGTGMGKSTMVREIALGHLESGVNVGLLMLEESVVQTMDDMISLYLSKPVRQIKAARELNEAMTQAGHDAIDFDLSDDLDEEEYHRARSKLVEKGLFLYNHHGVNNADEIIPKLEYMIQALDCKVVVLDHISAVIAAMQREGSEREQIDHFMAELRSVVVRTGVHLILVSQLRKADGKPYEEGGRISSQDLRGSGSLASVPNVIIAAERNQQHPDKDIANTIIVRSLKGRFNGRTGVVAALRYNRETARLSQVKFYMDSEGEVMFTPEFEDESQEFNTEEGDLLDEV